MDVAYVYCPGPLLKADPPKRLPTDGPIYAVNWAHRLLPYVDWWVCVDICTPASLEMSRYFEMHLPRVGLVTSKTALSRGPIVAACNERGLRIEAWIPQGKPASTCTITQWQTAPRGSFRYAVGTGWINIGFSTMAAIDIAARGVGPGGTVRIIGATMSGREPGDMDCRWQAERDCMAERMLTWKGRGVRVERAKRHISWTAKGWSG
jgi:hypothetical protein